MAETITVNYASQLTVAQTFDTTAAPASAGGGATITHDQWNTSFTASATGTTGFPETCTKTASFIKALSGGAATIDLTALTGTNGAAVDFTNLKVQFAKFKAPTTNANPITVTFGASTGYLLMGSGWKIILGAGQEFTFRGYDATPDVTASLKNIDLAGTASQSLYVQLVAG